MVQKTMYVSRYTFHAAIFACIMCMACGTTFHVHEVLILFSFVFFVSCHYLLHVLLVFFVKGK